MTKARDLGNLVSLNSFFADGTIQAGEITGLAASATIDTTNASNITSGTIAAARLPSYVDDVLEFANLAALPVTGETGKIYVALDTNKVYRWSGSTYVEISPAPDLSGYLPLSGGTMTGGLTLNSGTAGGVAYLNGSKVVTSGSALTFDGTTFGAGLIASTAAQNTDGQIRISNSTTRASGNRYGIRFADSTFETNAAIYAEQAASGNNAASLVFGVNAATGGIALTSATEGMRLTSTGLGIGTSSPAAKLDVTGTGLVSSFGSNTVAETYVQVKNGTSTLYLGGSSSYNYVYGTASVPLTFWTNSAERMRLDSSGNLGIGTGSPGARLNAVVSYVASTIVPSLKLSTVGGYNSGSGTAIDFGQDQGTYSTWVTGRIASPRTGSNWGGSLTFSTNDDSSATALVERARITSDGNLLVGTTVNHPSAKIMVEGNIFANYNNTVALRYNVSGQTNGYYKGFTGTSIENGIARGLHIFNYDQDSNFGICFYPNNYAGQTANPAMTLNSSGNLLIGTINQDVGGTVLGARITPSGKMLLATDNASGMFYDEPLYLDRRNTSGDGACIVLARNGYYKAAIGVVSNGLAAAGSMTFSTATNDGYTERMRITSGGGVGIGTTSPTRPLTIQAAGAAFPSTSNPSIRLDNTASGRFAVIESASDSNLYIVNGDADNASIIFRRGSGAGSESFRFGPAGQLGIAGANYGTSGQVLTSNGSGSAPTWQNAGGSAATPTALGTVYGKTDTATQAFLGYQAGANSPQYATYIGFQAGYNATTTAGNYGGTAIGYKSALALTTGVDNTFIGGFSGQATTTGGYNIAVGGGALFSNTTASGNTAVGYQALKANTTGSLNTAFGKDALVACTTGARNVAVGYETMIALTTGNNNVSMGVDSLRALTTGNYNTGIGDQALRYVTTASNNNALGYLSLFNNTGGSNNAFGTYALNTNTSGANNVAMGHEALYSNTTANENVAVGNYALQANTTGTANAAFGFKALTANTTANNNTAVGHQALFTKTTGNDNVALGASALRATTTGAQNTALGKDSLRDNTSASYNTAVGFMSYVQSTTGEYNVGAGYQVGYSVSTGSRNSNIGSFSGYRITSGADNTTIGYNAGAYISTGQYNICIGSQAGLSIAGTSNNIAIGQNALGAGSGAGSLTNGSNICIGDSAGYSITGSTYLNIIIGSDAGYSLTTGTDNTIIGSRHPAAGVAPGYYLTTGSSNVFIGRGSGSQMTTGSNNAIFGGFNGNSGGWDIRTSGSYVVLSNPYGGWYALSNGGSWYQVSNSSNWATVSDLRIKKNITTLTSGLDVITALRPVEFDYILKDKHEVGFIAQEYGTVLPEQIIQEHNKSKEIAELTNNEPVQVIEQNLVPYLVRAIQELNNKLELLQTELNTLKGN